MAKQQRYIVEEILRVPTDVETDTDAERVADEQERIGRKARERLLGLALIAHDRIGKEAWLVSVMSKVLAETVREMPNAHHEQCQHNHFSPRRKHVPELRPHHREEESREKQRNSREHGALAFAILQSIALQHLVH